MFLTKSQQRYPHYQKLLLSIIMTSRKVSHYFNEHPITIVSSAPLADILNNPEVTGRVAEWNIELSPRDLQFKHQTAIKAQVLPDFLVEWTELQTLGPPRPVKLMDNVLRQIKETTGSQIRSRPGVPQRNEAEIRPPNQLQQRL